MTKKDFDDLTLKEAIAAFLDFLENFSYFMRTSARPSNKGGYIVSIKCEDYRKRNVTINTKGDLTRYLKRNGIKEEFSEALEELEREDLKRYDNYFIN